MLTRYTAMVAGEPREITVESSDERRFVVRIDDGEPRELEVIATRPGHYRLLNSGQVHNFAIASMGRDGAVEVCSATAQARFSLLDEDMMARAAITSGGAGGAGAGVIEAPMPGRVVKLLVAEGDSVEIDQGVVVVEAMKMENELRAAVAGKVTEVTVSEGEGVESGQKLVVIEPNGDA